MKKYAVVTLTYQTHFHVTQSISHQPVVRHCGKCKCALWKHFERLQHDIQK